MKPLYNISLYHRNKATYNVARQYTPRVLGYVRTKTRRAVDLQIPILGPALDMITDDITRRSKEQ